MSLIKDLLTENRYWTFWTSDWSKQINVYWEGKTKFSEVIQDVRKVLRKTQGEEIFYERQIQLKEPDLSFK